MTGFAFQLSGIPGNLSLVIFGERDCANAMPRLRAKTASDPEWNVFSVGLQEQDVVAGLAEERLERCLRAVASPRWRPPGVLVPPEGIVVLSTCLSEMIGADPIPVCRKVEAETGVHIVPVATSGLRLRTQAEVGDWVARTMVIEFGRRGDRDPAAVNLIGYTTDPVERPEDLRRTFQGEVADALRPAGLRVNAQAPIGASLDDWRNLTLGGVSVVVDRAMYGDLLALLEHPGHRVIEMAQPYGVARTDAFYRAIAEATGRVLDDALVDLEARRAAVLALEEARERFTGRRLAYGIGSHHNFRPDDLASEGLGALPLMIEMGFEIEIVIQERDRPDVHERIQRNLKAMGVDLPYRLFYEPAVLAPVLAEGHFDVGYLSDFLMGQAAQVHLPTVALGHLVPGYRGVPRAVAQFGRAAGAVFESRYRKYL
jgi:nitrogenase molybdenum-iron protein alpha/beta subunit